MTTPSRNNDYQAASSPVTFLTRDLWNSVFGDIAARLNDREMLEASFELLQTQGIQASLDYIQATVAPQLETLQDEIALAQAQIATIIQDGIAPNSAKLGGQSPAYYATSQALADGLAAMVPKTRTINGKALSADVTLNKGDVGLGNADNTADADKPISTPVSNALAGLAQTRWPNANLADMAGASLKGRVAGAAGAPQDLTKDQARAVLGKPDEVIETIDIVNGSAFRDITIPADYDSFELEFIGVAPATAGDLFLNCWLGATLFATDEYYNDLLYGAVSGDGINYANLPAKPRWQLTGLAVAAGVFNGATGFIKFFPGGAIPSQRASFVSELAHWANTSGRYHTARGGGFFINGSRVTALRLSTIPGNNLGAGRIILRGLKK
ncbi:hypothetical protein [Aurantimonas phage AmM-1]|uniref:virion structural protein n=1 Tax=Aurantimonas phage AmM-1 TaxID=1503929 RepID=UPI0005412A13|nr:virion structural protein [Aurantimonas phage AmM-1]BAP94475.1 hypothetical protein [Aurantimonas phage AmM-1]